MIVLLRNLVILLLVGAVQTAVTAAWLPLSVFDALMLACGMMAVRSGWGGAVLAGSAAGLIQDMLGGGLIGVHGFAKTLIAAAISWLSNIVVVRGPLAESLLIGLAAIAEGMLARALLTAVAWPAGESVLWTIARGPGTAILAGILLLGGPAVVQWRQRRRARGRLRFR